MFDYSSIFAGNASLINGLISYFNFNETPGWRSNSSTLGSSSSHINTKAWDYADNGYGGGVMTFDGASTIRHIVSDDVQYVAPSAMSASIRFRVTDSSENRTQILFETGDGNIGLNIYLHGGQLIVGGWSKGVWSTYLATDMPNDGDWHTVAFSYEAGIWTDMCLVAMTSGLWDPFFNILRSVVHLVAQK